MPTHSKVTSLASFPGWGGEKHVAFVSETASEYFTMGKGFTEVITPDVAARTAEKRAMHGLVSGLQENEGIVQLRLNFTSGQGHVLCNATGEKVELQR